MKTTLALLCATLISASLFCAAAAEGKTKPVRSEKRGALVHMVSFKFKPEATPAQIKEVETAFAALKKQIPQIVSFEWGTNVSPEGLDKGFTHGFILTFKNAADRDAYLVHPDHKKFGALVGPVLADVFVVDFVSRR
ncbi:MAG: Dabb family protein [Verrucomicrobia bacterium]|nr:Dabb family protein [Verrucomicrobiota bacterium]